MKLSNKQHKHNNKINIFEEIPSNFIKTGNYSSKGDVIINALLLWKQLTQAAFASGVTVNQMSKIFLIVAFSHARVHLFHLRYEPVGLCLCHLAASTV